MRNNRVALVTGGSKGIGRAICIALSRAGICVALNYNTSAVSASEVKSEIQKSGGEAFITKADICKESEIIAMVKNTVQHFDRLDILVNCAGIMPTDPIETMSLTSWNNVITTNLTSCFLVIRESLPYLKKSTCPRIINIGSQAAFTGSSQHAHYAASKSGLLGLTYSLAKELGPFGITVNVVSPGRVNTDMLSYSTKEKQKEWITGTPLNRLATVDEIANVVVFLASAESSYITGANLNVNGGMLMG